MASKDASATKLLDNEDFSGPIHNPVGKGLRGGGSADGQSMSMILSWCQVCVGFGDVSFSLLGIPGNGEYSVSP